MWPIDFRMLGNGNVAQTLLSVLLETYPRDRGVLAACPFFTNGFGFAFALPM